MRDTNPRDRKNQEFGEAPEFEEKVVSIDRVTRVVKGGRRLRFRATVVVGNKKGKVGVGVDKGNEVMTAVQKAVARAKRDMIEVNLNGTTIAHELSARKGGAYVFLKPASEGTGVIAGGAVRAVLEAAGIRDILSKMIGSNSKINNAYATILALKDLKATPVSSKTKVEKVVVDVITAPTSQSGSRHEVVEEAK